MGKFLTALHVKTTGKEQFIEKFTQLMKKDGYVPCSEDEAAISYAAAFSEGGWVTLSNGDSTTTELSKTAKKIAEEMDTLCFTAEVVDSDFAILNLFAQNGSESRVIVGDGSGYGIEKAPFLADMWKPLIQSKDEREFVRTLSLENTFVEDTLYDIGNILGITPSVMTWCYDEFEEEIGHDGNVISLSFRKAAEKKLSLNAAFKQVFGEALEPLGFKLVKSKYPYFVRVVPGGEIIHVISLKTEAPYLHTIGRAGFSVLSGAATVYRPKIDLSVSPKSNARWLFGIRKFYNESNRSDFDSEFNNGNLCESSYIEGSSESLLEVMEQALKRTISIVIPVLEKIVDMDSCARFCTIYNMGFSLKEHFDAIKNGIIDPNDINNEGLLIMRIKDYVGYIDWKLERDRIQKKALVELPHYKYSQKEYEDYCNSIDEIKKEHLLKMSDVVKNTQFYNKIILELENRKQSNSEILRSYGIENNV